MGILDDAQNVLVEVGGMILFALGVYNAFDGGVAVIEALLFIVVGLLLMGYKRIADQIRSTVEQFRG